MRRILFVCHGNICRSAMAEWIMKDLVKRAGMEEMFEIDSAAVSREEIGNDLYPPAKICLHAHGIPFGRHFARQVTKRDYDNFDEIYLMDSSNLRNIRRIFPSDPDHKIHMLPPDRSIADPWYTDNFERTYMDLMEGCQRILDEPDRSV